MKHFLILISCVCAINASPLQTVKRVGRPRIFGGQSISIENVPYQVSIIKIDENGKEKHECGGSIISKNLVLTAGHCISLEPKKYLIRSGSTFWNKGGQLHKVIKIIMHQGYFEDTFERPNNDIAIMKIKSIFALDGETEKIIKLVGHDEKVKTGDKAYVAGWGVAKGNILPDNLQGLSLEIMDFHKCSQDYKHFGEMTKHSICAEHLSGIKDACAGDSGGPLVVNGKQVGIVSWSGPGCAIPGRPGVYTAVAHYRQWIEQHMNI